MLARVFFLLALLCAASCTHEHIVLDVDEGGEDAEYVTSGDGGARVCIAAGPGQACRPNGGQCTVAADCCSLRCSNGECLPAGTCSAPGLPCADRTECCSGRCDPGAAGATVCLDYCAPNGAACTAARGCCALACDGDGDGCGTHVCHAANVACDEDTDCCSGICRTGLCVLPASSACLGTGEACGGPTMLTCCSGACTDGVCAFGAGPCLAVSSPCAADTDCCRGQCTSQNGRKTCAAACLGTGASCGTAADCCGGLCTGNPPVCGDAQSICRVVGQSCGSADDCCTGDCVGGYCAVTCAAP